MPERPLVSVVIPTWNEATTIGRCLGDPGLREADEVVVADAGSPDGTARLAERGGALVVSGPKGRGAQQNRGASASRGDLLLFVHADCRLERGAIASLRRFATRNPRVPGGCFRMRVEHEHWGYRPIDAAAHLRAVLAGIPYGDQGIFCPRWAFEAVGGFPEVPLMDDVFFADRLRRLGRIALLPERIAVSPRRWERHGIVGQSLRNWALTALAALGAPPSWLSRCYPVVR